MYATRISSSIEIGDFYISQIGIEHYAYCNNDNNITTMNLIHKDLYRSYYDNMKLYKTILSSNNMKIILTGNIWNYVLTNLKEIHKIDKNNRILETIDPEESE